jgi:aspartate racemase
MQENKDYSKSGKHIGIVGCSAEGAALCYKTICTESSQSMGLHIHPEISVHTHSMADYVDYLDKQDIQGVGDIMLSSANKLAAIGADFLICPDNTIHQAFDYVEQNSPLPWLHIAEEVVKSAKQRGFQKLGILGTQWLTESSVYPNKIEAAGLEWVRPKEEAHQALGRIIMHELVYGKFLAKSIAYFQTVIDDLKTDGCDAVILGCTEIPLIIDDSNSSLPTLDSNRLLAEAAIKFATN